MLICADIIEIEKIEEFFKENERAKGDDVVHVSLPYGRILEIGHRRNCEQPRQTRLETP